MNTPAYYEASGCDRLRFIVKNGQLHFAVLLIVTAALVKGAVEEILPFFADHHWHFDPYEVGLCFTNSHSDSNSSSNANPSFKQEI